MGIPCELTDSSNFNMGDGLARGIAMLATVSYGVTLGDQVIPYPTGFEQVCYGDLCFVFLVPGYWCGKD